MIETVVVVPSPPMLLPEYVGLHDPAGPVRERCVEALSAALREPYAACDVVVIVTGRERIPRTRRAPLGVRVGRHLLDLVGWSGAVEEVVVPFDADAAEVQEAGRELRGRVGRALVVVVADGSARRSEKAPGHLDERAFGLDDALLKALAEVDPVGLLAIDARLAADVLASGRAALQVMAHAVDGTRRLQGGLLWSDDPYGVMYALAVWSTSDVGAR